MPRKAKPSAGAKPQRTDAVAAKAPRPATQPARAPTGMPYGNHAETIESQKKMPLPQGGAPSAPAPGPGAPAPGAGGGFAAAIGAAAGMPAPVSPLSGPSLYPDQPVQAGLSLGPGSGPVPTQADSPRAAGMLARMAEASMDPDMGELAALARELGA